jgi:hypothetical protein
MSFETTFINKLFTDTADNFEALALELYRHQAINTQVYRDFHTLLNRDPLQANGIEDILFLPISFFKSHQVLGSGYTAELVFESSGTTGMSPSRHPVADTSLYRRASRQIFRERYGAPSEWTILALLPSYLERGNSSLVYMVNMLMMESPAPANDFYLNQFAELARHLELLCLRGQKVLLFGVTFALLDFAAAFPMPLPGVTIMETGGMKGRGAELTREELHERLHAAWPGVSIHSEYGMTELLSQAYASEQQLFVPGATMKALVREVNDPLSCARSGSGVLNIIDLANVYSCAFIATEDLCKVSHDGTFEVLGRLDFAALRGCSLLSV